MERPVPIIGWRAWRIVDDSLMGSWRGVWRKAYLQGKCRLRHSPPMRHCGCGIYSFLKMKNARHYSISWHYMYFAEIAFSRLFVISVVALSLAALYLYWVQSSYLLGVLQWEMALLAFMLYRRVTTTTVPCQGVIFGAVAGSGKVLYYPDQGMRSQNSRIVCLIRPSHLDPALAKKIAHKYSLPLFEYSAEEEIMEYVKEHGDILLSVPLPPSSPFSWLFGVWQKLKKPRMGE